MKRKKGIQLNQAFGAVLTLVLLGVLIIISIFLFDSLGATLVSSSVITITNESNAYINSTGYTLADASVCNFASPGISGAFNASSNAPILLANITLSSDGIITNATNTVFTNVLISYTYNWGGEACVASDDLIVQFAAYTTLVGLVGTIIFLGIVIGVLVTSFVFGRREKV